MRTTNPLIVALLFWLVVMAGAFFTGLLVMVGAWALHEVFPSIPALSYWDSFLVGMAVSIFATLIRGGR